MSQRSTAPKPRRTASTRTRPTKLSSRRVTSISPSSYRDFFAVSGELLNDPQNCLLASVILRAVNDAAGSMENARLTPTARLETMVAAQVWLFDDDSREPWSLTWACEHLGLAVCRVRAGIRAYLLEALAA